MCTVAGGTAHVKILRSMMHPARRTRVTRLLATGMLSLLLGITVVWAVETAEPEAGSTATPTTQSEEKEGQTCTWACLKWGRICNIDPRGIYQCHRNCERFGQQCE